MTRSMERSLQLATVVVVGLGNIGSHLVSHLARLAEIGRVVLIDPDRYAESNRPSQAIGSDHVGRSKVDVQMAVARGANPGLAVSGISEWVEDVPLGCLRADLIFACLDSRTGRQYLNEAARRLGVPWIDAGVEPESWLARVNVYEPGSGAPCLECAWDQPDYDALPQRYPCRPTDAGPTTAAPSSLGGLAASLQAIEGRKLLSGHTADAMVSAQVLIDARTYQLYRTAMRRNPHCRLPHDDPAEVTPVDATVGQLTVGEAFTWGSATDGRVPPGLRVPMHTWATRQLCLRCGRVATGVRLQRSLPRCVACGSPTTATGFDQMDELVENQVPSGGSLTLETIGLRDRDVLGIGRPGHWTYIELGVTAPGEERR